MLKLLPALFEFYANVVKATFFHSMNQVVKKNVSMYDILTQYFVAKQGVGFIYFPAVDLRCFVLVRLVVVLSL
jgi:hypothetical protein